MSTGAVRGYASKLANPFRSLLSASTEISRHAYTRPRMSRLYAGSRIAARLGQLGLEASVSLSLLYACSGALYGLLEPVCVHGEVSDVFCF